MYKMRFKYTFVLCSALIFFGGSPVRFGKEKSFFHGFSIPNPVIRIGLGTHLQDIEIYF